VITDELHHFLASGLSILVGTADREGRPFAVRAVAARVEAGGTELVTFLPDALSARVLADLRENPRLAVCFGRPEDHRTVQLKGSVLEVRAAEASDRECVERYRAAFAQTMAFIGMPPDLTMNFVLWPCQALRMRVEQVFSQTPGPNAGARLDVAGKA
jgi:pyridoxine/pyridoxamine 5'-phosphate oxidase